ncbi:putative TIM-barrel fold metal-dependent hydrolase [Amycolatopsis lexingtonensis]|uniref:TIM-barrel fold metal-dependent hydrolase n=1 Tax=Amycolatopsis lexingtonensis TaxID=218822 RepID=A0ABR9HWU2_9PSEU|nr:amidohydrolase family protein [Amycolatopsis lexingtonensis]MBE1495405.1 putative TIM-barrel fold metal-dependent hydrolase [Amycolatopsis lexingtonensis]
MSGLVDVHAHFLTPEYVEAAIAAGHARPDGMPGWPNWDASTHLELMDRWGVAVSLLSISSPGVHFGDDAAARKLARHVNDTGAAVRRAHPDRFGHFASLPLPDVDGALAELAYAVDELGSDGVTIETNAAGRYLGDPAFGPLWTELERRRTPVFVHPTSPPHAEGISLGRPRPMLEFLYDTGRAVSDLVFAGVPARHPGIPWIFTHGGGVLPLLAERLELFRTAFAGESGGPTVPGQIGELWFDIAGTPFPHQVPAFERAFGTERLLYGSDFCWTPPAAVAAQLASIDAAPQPAGTTWRELTTRNCSRLFPRL